MADFNNAFQILMGLEFSRPEKALHKNPTEREWTFMGIYQKYHSSWKGWNEILAALAYGGDTEKISRMLFDNKDLRDEVWKFYNGIMGEISLAAINKVDEEKFDKEFDRAELEHYNMLIKQNPKLRVYANGWRRRAEAV